MTVQVAIPPQHRLYADQFHVEVPAPASLIPRFLPAPEKQADPLSGKETLVFTRFFQALYAIENLNTNRLPVTVRWQGCNETTCFLPVTKTFLISWADVTSSTVNVSATSAEDLASTVPADWRALTNRFMLVAQRSGYLSPSELLSFLEAAQGQGRAMPELPADRWLQRSLWLSILILLFGGLALNLTPCVLPMIPVNLAIIGAGTGAQSRRRGAGLGALYGLGMAAAYGILGLLVVLTGSKFGAINASPWFNVSVALLFAVLALAMLDVYTIDFSRFQGRFNTIGMGGGNSRCDGNRRLSGALVIVALGALAAILSGACVAPVVLSVLLLSTSLYAQGHGAALLL
ncbi:MAG: cytochrome c biogenesis protein CcdA, partial [Kiritimatiellota bacterium]|nr:cytochrome c biogenesis protein CcdA [Kiritimatiellota bacterium]